MKCFNLFAKKVVTFSVVATMLLSTLTAQSAHFTDASGHWASEVIEKWAQHQILSGFGDGAVRPDDPISKAQLNVILNKFMKHTVAKEEYSDVAWGQWYYNDMMALKDKGIFNTSFDNKAYPDSYMAREDAIAAIARAFDVVSDLKVTRFKDDSKISADAKPFIAAMQAKGYVVGDGNGYFFPKRYFTRAEVFTIINKVVGNYINEAKTYDSIERGNTLVNIAGASLKDIVVTGDLYITPGVKDGNVTLDNVTVNGRTIIQGGGRNSIHFKNGTKLVGNIIVKNTDRTVRIAVDSTSSVEGNIFIKTDAILDGTYKNVSVMDKGVEVEIRGKVERISLEASDASVVAKKDAIVSNVIINDINSVISGEGQVKKVEVLANGVQVNTAETQVVVGAGVTGAVVGNTELKAGSTVITNASGTGITQILASSNGDGSSDSGSSSNNNYTTYTSLNVSGVNVNDATTITFTAPADITSIKVGGNAVSFAGATAPYASKAGSTGNVLWTVKLSTPLTATSVVLVVGKNGYLDYTQNVSYAGVVFIARTDDTVRNNQATLGLVAQSLDSSDISVAGAEFTDNMSSIRITSYKAGEAIITASDSAGNVATIEVSVAVDGTITIGAIAKYVASVAVTGVNVSGIIQVLAVLTASPTYSGGTGTVEYKWYRIESGSTATVSDTLLGTGSAYSLVDADVGKYVYCVVTASGSTIGGIKASNVVGPITAEQDIQAPTVTTVTPADGATNVAINVGTIAITFSEDILLGSSTGLELADGSIAWTDLATTLPRFKFGTTAGGSQSAALITGASYAQATNTLTLAVDTLENRQQYFITIDGICDLAGNALVSAEKSFTTEDSTLTFSVLGVTYTTNRPNASGLAVKPIEPVRAGFTFMGWYTEEDGGLKIIFAEDAENDSSLTPYIVKEDMTLYAHWQHNLSRMTGQYVLTLGVEADIPTLYGTAAFYATDTSTLFYIRDGEQLSIPLDTTIDADLIVLLTEIGTDNLITMTNGKVTDIDLVANRDIDLMAVNLENINVSIHKGSVNLPVSCLEVTIPKGYVVFDDNYATDDTPGISYLKTDGTLIIILPTGNGIHKAAMFEILDSLEAYAAVTVAVNVDEMIEKVKSITITLFL